MRPPDPGEVRRILIRANNWIGDVVMISPAVRAIRERFTGARIAILAKRWVLDALGGNPFFDELVEYDHEGRHAGVAGRMHLAAELRRGGAIDLAVLFQKAFDAAAIAWMSGARVRVGYATDWRSLLLTHAIPLPRADTHHVEVFLGLARALGCPVRETTPFFHLTDADRARAQAELAAAGVGVSTCLVAIHPGASKEPRAWHAGRFASVARGLRASHGATFLLLGGPADGPLLAQIRGALPQEAIVSVPENGSLKESAARLARCQLFIGNDSGPMHLASALGVPTIGLFGPGSPRTTGPTGTAGRAVALGRDYPCSPCGQNFFRECPPAPSGKPFCLEEVTAQDVEAAASALLARVRARSGGGHAPGQPAQSEP